MNLNFSPASFNVSPFSDDGDVMFSSPPEGIQQNKHVDDKSAARASVAKYEAAEQHVVHALNELSKVSRQVANDGVDNHDNLDKFSRTIGETGKALFEFSSHSVAQAGKVNESATKEQIAQRVEDVMSAGIEVMHIFMNLISNQANGKFDEMRNKAKVSADAKEKSTIVDGVLAGLVKPEDTAALPADVIAYMRENNILVDGKTIDEFLPSSEKTGGLIQYLENLIAQSHDGLNAIWDAKWRQIVILLRDNPQLTIEGGQSAYSFLVNTYGSTGHWNNISKYGLQQALSVLKQLAQSVTKTQLTQIKGAIDNVANRAGDFVTQTQLELQKLMQLFSMLTNQISTLQTKKKDDIGTIIRGMG